MKNPGVRNLASGSSEIRQPARWWLGRGLLMVVCLSLLALWTLPIMNRWIRDELIQQLAERVGHAPDDRVDVPVRQLAGFGLQAIDTLVAIAASPRAASATVAREMVIRQVATWVIRDRELQMQEAADKLSPFMSLRLSRLAGALVRHVDSLDTAGRRWAQRLTMQIVLHADRITSAGSVQVLADCEAVLAVVTSEELKPRNQEVSGQAVTEEPHLSPLTRPAIQWDLFATAPGREPGHLGQHQQNLYSPPGGGLHPDAAGSASQKSQDADDGSLFSSPEEMIDFSGPPPWFRDPTESLPAGNLERDLAGPSDLTGNPLREPTQAEPSKASAASAADPATALPLVTDCPPAPLERVLDVPTPPEMAARRQQLEAMSLRDLMVRLGSASDFEAALIRAAARARGFADAELTLAPLLASSRVEERFALLRKLPLLPASRARRWLRWLLEDIDGEVRLRALVMMATTGDAQLDALARQRVLEDPDPRVVEQATRIIESRR